MTKAERFNRRQKKGRDAEWEAFVPFLAERAPGTFLDVGCGTGYAMVQGKKLGFEVFGVDPELSKFGVHDASVKVVSDRMVTAAAEDLPFENDCFDLIYSSHAIEHFADPKAGVAEMARVLKPGGRAVLMVPTGTMAAILVVSRWLFYTHRAVAKFVVRTRSLKGFLHIFLGEPHGTEASFAIGEIKKFSISRWQSLVADSFEVEQVLLPCLYPWPDYPPLFPMMRLKRFSTSVVFICSKKTEPQID
ncbi:MAG: class I SAM-dependent methyltransferase [Acidobacteria bacterium]|nr:class I SAM-dependent methyltransferase [Acidobacteriota bacterium]